MERIPPETSNAVALNALYKTLNISQKNSDVDVTQPILESASLGVMISSKAKDIGKLYNELKTTGNDEALEGFREVVQNLAGNLDSQSLNKLVSLGKEAVDQGETDVYAELLSTAHTLNEEGKSGMSISVIKEAANTSSEQDFESAKEFIETADTIMNAGFDTTKEKLSTLQDFVNTWNNVRSQDKEPEQIQADLNAFAEKTKTVEADKMQDLFAQVNQNISNGNNISDYT